MKRIFILLISFVIFYSCDKDDDPLASPEFSWQAERIADDTLLIISQINTAEKLPKGSLELYIDGHLKDIFTPKKGRSIYTTTFTFNDLDVHQVNLIYIFKDGRPSLSENKELQKQLITTLETSEDGDWQSY